MSSNELLLDFAGEERALVAGDELLFGRGAELDIDDNPLLHRSFGRLFHSSGSWWLRNEGSRLSLHVHDLASTSAFTLAPGGEAALSFRSAAIRFEAGASSYELLVDQPEHAERQPADCRDVIDNPLVDTIDQSNLPLRGGQRLLLVALAESKLRDPHAKLKLPTNKSVAHRFGWSTTTFNRRLDRLCVKFADVGVQGVVGGSSDMARNRRQRLVEHAIKVGVISTADLAMLDEFPS